MNEAPEFKEKTYEAKIFSIAPYKYPVVQVLVRDAKVNSGKPLHPWCHVKVDIRFLIQLLHPTPPLFAPLPRPQTQTVVTAVVWTTV